MFIAVEVELPKWRKAVNFMCGLQTQQIEEQTASSEIKLSPEEEAELEAGSIQDDPFWSK